MPEKEQITLFLTILDHSWTATLYHTKPTGSDWRGRAYQRIEKEERVYHCFTLIKGSMEVKMLDVIAKFERGDWQLITL